MTDWPPFQPPRTISTESFGFGGFDDDSAFWVENIEIKTELLFYIQKIEYSIIFTLAYMNIVFCNNGKPWFTFDGV